MSDSAADWWSKEGDNWEGDEDKWAWGFEQVGNKKRGAERQIDKGVEGREQGVEDEVVAWEEQTGESVTTSNVEWKHVTALNNRKGNTWLVLLMLSY